MATEKLTFEMNAVGNAVPEMKKAQAQVQRLGKTIQTTGGQVAASGKGVQRYGMIAQQAGFQVGDMAVQVAGGTSAIQAFGQQGSQLLGVFGPVGAVLGAVVAIASAVGVAFMRSRGEAKSFTDVMESVSENINNLEGLDEVILTNLQKPISESHAALNEYLKGIQKIQFQEVIVDVREGIGMMTKDFADGAKRLETFTEKTRENVNRLLAIPREERTENDVKMINKLIDRIEIAQVKQEAFNNIVNQFSMATQAESVEQLAQQLIEARDNIEDAGYLGEGLNQQFIEMMEASGLHNVVLKEQKKLQIEITEAAKETKDQYEKIGKTALSIVEAQFMLKKGILPPQAAADFKVVNEEVERVYENLRRVSREPEKASSSLKKTKKAVTELSPEMKRLMDVSDMVGSSFETAFMSAIKGTASMKDAFRAMAVDIIAELYRIFVIKKITGFISDAISLFGGAAPGSSGSIFGGMKAIGGPVQAGNSYIVGERGPELFVPSRTGSIVSNDKMGGGGGVVVQQTINVSTGVQQTVRNEIQTLLPQIAEASKAAVLDARRRGGSFANAF